jgi:hypothetical protein
MVNLVSLMVCWWHASVAHAVAQANGTTYAWPFAVLKPWAFPAVTFD